MFANLNEQVRLLNSDVNNVANSEKAKKLRKKLLSIGIPVAILGYGGVFACFIAFTVIGFTSVNDGSAGFPTLILIPFFLIIPCAIIGSIGLSLVRIGLRIVVTGYTSKLINDVVQEKCPNCGDVIDINEIFCSNCGSKLKKVCPKCETVNKMTDNYCIKCGEKL